MKKDNYVVKANQFIEAKGKLGLLEQKILACLISEIKPTDDDLKEYRIHIKDISEFMEIDSKAAYKLITGTLDNLLEKTLKVETIDPQTGKMHYRGVNLLSSADYTEGTGEVNIEISNKLKPYIIALKGDKTPYTKYMIKIALSFSSKYTLRLYELLKRFEGKWIKSNPDKPHKSEDLKELRDKLGIEENNYKAFTDFEKRVLKPAKEEINNKSDIIIDYKKIKKGRRIAEIEFTVFPKHIDEETEKHKKFKEAGVFDYDEIRENTGLQDEYFSDKQIAELYEIACKVTERFNGDPVIYIAMTYAYSKIRKPKAMFAYLKKALEENFVNHYESVSDNDYQDNKEEAELEGQVGLDELQHLRTQIGEKERDGE
ncbi:MAG: replication initiation protein [Bacteroidota bacterium]